MKNGFIPKGITITESTPNTISTMLFVDDYAPTAYLDLSKYVCLTICVKPYKKKNGDSSSSNELK